MDAAKLTIKAVAGRTGVPVHTLRAWERRYGVPLPQRGEDNRYRLYDEQDIADVLFLKQQVESGVAPSQASLILHQRRKPPVSGPAPTSTQPVDSIRAALLEAFARADETSARQVLDESFAMFTPEQVALQIIEPTMKDIGARWMRNEMTVWQEHLASNVIQQKLFAILQSQPELPVSAPLLAAACAPSEEHQLGLLILVLLARRQGWRVAYLGQNTPIHDIADLALTSKTNVVAISVTTVVGLANLIPWLKATNRPAAPLVFGGRMLNLLPALRAHLPGDYLGDNTMAAVRSLAAVQRRAEEWSPSKRALEAIDLLQAQRLGFAGEVAAELVAIAPRVHRSWDATHLKDATLFLLDSLACALAFQVPELMDLQQQWLNEAMPPRSVTPPLIARHLQIVESVLHKQLAEEYLRFFAPLLERMQNST